MIHKHIGVLLSSGALRPHPVERQHGDKDVQMRHNAVLKANEQKYRQGMAITENKTLPKQMPKTEMFKKKVVECGIDNEGYINIDLDEAQVQGIRLKFSRRENSKIRTVGLQIEKK
jgi:hypothetical protein